MDFELPGNGNCGCPSVVPVALICRENAPRKPANPATLTREPTGDRPTRPFTAHHTGAI